MNVEVRQAAKEEQNQIEALLNDYLAELSQHREICVGATRASEYRYLKDYWTDSSRISFTLWTNGELAGFAFVRRTEEDQKPVFQVANLISKNGGVVRAGTRADRCRSRDRATLESTFVLKRGVVGLNRFAVVRAVRAICF